MSRPTRTDDASAGLTAANSGMNRRRFLAGTAALAAGGMLMGRPLPAAAQEAPAKGAATRAASSYKLDLGGYAGPELTSQPITLKFMRQEFPPHVNAVLEEAYKEFSAAYPNITIQEEKVPYGDLQKKMQIYVGSGAAPDVMMGRTDFIEAYHAGNIALPLQDYFLDEFLHDILDNQFKAASAKGNFYGAPWETYFTMMYFNRDIFKKAGVPTPPEVTDVNAGWTAEEFIAALDELTQKLRAQGDSTTWALSAATHGNGGPGANYTQVESLWVRSQGDPNADKGSSAYKTFLGVSEDGLQATGYLDTPEAVKGMSNYQQLFTKKLAPPTAVPNQFVSGVGAIHFTGLNQASRLFQQKPAFEWGASPFPRGRIAFNCNSSDCPIVWSKTPYPAEAAALVAYLCNDANRIRFYKTWGSMPVRKSLIAAIPEFGNQQLFQLSAAAAASGQGAPRSVGWFDYFNAINPVVRDIALGGDPESQLKQAATRIDGLLRKYR